LGFVYALHPKEDIEVLHKLPQWKKTQYAVLIIETIFEWYAKIYNLNYAALRYFNAAGHAPSTKFTVVEQDPQNLIPIILETALGKRKILQIFGNDYATHDGTCLRDYIHVCDIAEAHPNMKPHPP
jgi:UDP-glucose 4-epimerase